MTTLISSIPGHVVASLNKTFRDIVCLMASIKQQIYVGSQTSTRKLEIWSIPKWVKTIRPKQKPKAQPSYPHEYRDKEEPIMDCSQHFIMIVIIMLVYFFQSLT